MDYIVIIMLMLMVGLLPIVDFFEMIFDDPLMFFLNVVIVVSLVIAVFCFIAYLAQLWDE